MAGKANSKTAVEPDVRTIPRPAGRTRNQHPPASTGGERATEPSEALGTELTLTLDGREFRLASWGLKSLLLAQERFGSVTAFQSRLLQMMPKDDESATEPDWPVLLFCIWLSVRRHQPDITEDELSEIIPVNPAEMLRVLTLALAVSGLNSEGPSGPPDLPTGN